VDIQGEYKIGVPRQRVFDAMMDPEILQKCIPGCEEMEMVSDTEYKAVIKASIGPVKAAFKTSMKLENLSPPASFTLSGEGKGGVAGFGRGSADITLDETDGVTHLRYEANLKVGGKLAQVGSRLVSGVTRKIADDFFGTFSSILDSGAEKVETEQDRILAGKRATRNKVLMIAGLIVVLLLIYWFATK
jgi:carbon monoxide dehydrogenase subunit G